MTFQNAQKPAVGSRRGPGGALTTLALLSILTVSACSSSLAGHRGLSDSTTCKEFINASPQDETDLVERLYHKAHPEEAAAGPAAANAVFNVSYECSTGSDAKVADLGDFRS